MDWAAVAERLGDVPTTYQRSVARYATGNVQFSTGGVGSPVKVPIPAGTIVATSAGAQFFTIGSLTLPAGAQAISLPVQAAVPGASSNVPAGAINVLLTTLAQPLLVSNPAPTGGGVDSPFTWLMNSITAGLARYANAADGLISQLAFQAALGTWLDTWGQLFNFRRNNNESDGDYKARIQFLLGRPPASDVFPGAHAPAQGGKGPPISIENYIYFVQSVSATVIEAFPAIGYVVQLGPQSVATYTQIAQNLKYVRPAGVPFLPFLVLRGGLYLDTLNYLNAPKVTGAYLLDPISPLVVGVSATTNNATPLLPTTFLTDPTLNPSLA